MMFSISYFIGLLEGSQSFYKCAGLVSCFLFELTNYDQSEFQFYANEIGFDLLHETAVDCILAMETTEKSWNFLLNRK